MHEGISTPSFNYSVISGLFRFFAESADQKYIVASKKTFYHFVGKDPERKLLLEDLKTDLRRLPE